MRLFNIFMLFVFFYIMRLSGLQLGFVILSLRSCFLTRSRMKLSGIKMAYNLVIWLCKVLQAVMLPKVEVIMRQKQSDNDTNPARLLLNEISNKIRIWNCSDVEAVILVKWLWGKLKVSVLSGLKDFCIAATWHQIRGRLNFPYFWWELDVKAMGQHRWHERESSGNCLGV